MRALSFENLRRLVGRRKDRDEPSFERSESFKRISIRKSYLDRGKRRHRLQKVVDPDTSLDPRARCKVSGSPQILLRCREEIEEDKKELENTDYEKRIESPDGTIVYDEWIHQDSTYSSREKKIDSSSSQIDSIHSSREFDSRQELEDRKKRNLPKRNNLERRRAPPPPPPRNIELSPVLIDLPHSPVSQRQRHREEEVQEVILVAENDDQHREESNYSQDCNCSVVSVNLGRVWRDAAVPSHSFSSGQGTEGSSREEKLRPSIARTVSAPEKNPVSKSDSSRDGSRSGFSFSLSISRLTTDLRAAAVTTKNGLFRRKKGSKPAPSVSTEGYFERTAAASMRRSGKTNGSRRRTYCSRRKKIVTSSAKPRVPGSPVWFVPPERRRSGRQKGRVWREVRYFPEDHVQGEDMRRRDLEERSNDWSSNLSDEFDDRKLLLSGDFDERVRSEDGSKSNYRNENQTTKTNNRNLDSSTIESSTTSLMSSASSRFNEGQPPAPKISDFNEDKIFCEEFRGDKTVVKGGRGANYFASSQFLGFLSKKDAKTVEIPFRNGVGSRYQCLSSSESETEEVVLFVDSKKENSRVGVDDESSESDRSCSVVLLLEGQRSSVRSGEISGPRRRPLRRKSQLKRANCRGQPVYLARKRSSLRRRPCSKKIMLELI